MELLTTLLICGFGGVGFAALIQASPLGEIPYKPFVCRTCLSGWGSIGCAAAMLVHVDDAAAWWLSWATFALAGTGLAHLAFGLADNRAARFDEGGFPTPPPTDT